MPDSVGCLIICQNKLDQDKLQVADESVCFPLEKGVKVKACINSSYTDWTDLSHVDIIFYQKPEMKASVISEQDADRTKIPEGSGSIGLRLVEFAKREGLFTHMVGLDRGPEQN